MPVLDLLTAAPAHPSPVMHPHIHRPAGGYSGPSTVKLYRGPSGRYMFSARLALEDGTGVLQLDTQASATDAPALARRIAAHAPEGTQMLGRNGVADADPVLAALRAAA